MLNFKNYAIYYGLMRRTNVILITLFLFTINLYSQSLTIFTDGFTNSFTNDNKIDTYTNLEMTNIGGNYYVVLSNGNWTSNGNMISQNIRLSNGYQWEYLIFDYSFITNGFAGPPADFYIDVLKSDNTVLISTITDRQYPLTNITESTIKLRAKFIASPVGNKSAILDFWKITIKPKEKEKTTVSEYEPKYKDRFYGAPAPFKIGAAEKIRFYYEFKKDCKITLKIYDVNYRLVRIIKNGEYYSAHENLDATWNGKNGAGYFVMSGVYVAVLEIENDDGSTEKPDPFVFAVIK